VTTPVVIVGASLGGLRAAEGLRRSGYLGRLTIIGDEQHLPYNRPPLSKAMLTSTDGLDSLSFPHRPEISDVDWMLGTRISSANLNERTLTDSAGTVLPYSALVAATGVRPKRIPTHDGRSLGNCFALRTLEDAVALRDALLPGRRVVIAGAGFIACEVAAIARTVGCVVVVVGSDRHPMERPLGPELSAELMRRHEDRGVGFVMNRRVVRAQGTNVVSSVVLDDATVLSCDVLVEAIGSVANTEWLADNDVDLELGVRTDSSLRALKSSGGAWPDVFAVGDVARFPNALFGTDASAVEHWNIPVETAKRAAGVLARQLSAQGPAVEITDEPFAPVPSFWSDQFDIRLLAYGMLELADTVVLLDGTPEGDCVYGYFRAGRMVGVCGIGARSTVMKYRSSLLEPYLSAPEKTPRMK
jgi:3-phenylpropionate/trans-cinnamate dioxygenase ferredoxin reductase subunit